MISLGRLLFLLLLFLKVHASDSIENRCAYLIKNESDLSCIEAKSISTPLLKSSALSEWSWIIEKANEKKAFLQAEIDNNKGMLRFLRSGFVEAHESRQWYEEQFNNIQEDFEQLRIVAKELETTSNKLNQCFRVCTPKMRVDLEEKLQQLQKLKLLLLSKRPVLAGPDIEGIILTDSYNQKVFKQSLVNTYSDYLSAAQDKVSEIKARFIQEESDFNYSNNSRTNELRESRLKNFLEALGSGIKIDDVTNELLNEIDWSSEVSNPETGKLACHLYQKNKDYIESEEIKDIAIEAGFIVVPLVTGPAFRLGVWGLRSAGIAKWGMRKELFSKITQSSASLSAKAYYAKEAIELPLKSKECEALLDNFILSKEQGYYQKYIECGQEYRDDILLFAAESAWVGFSSIGSVVKSVSTAKKATLKDPITSVKDLEELNFCLSSKCLNNGGHGYKVQLDKGDYYAINLKNSDKKAAKLSDDYWNFVADTYRKRLNLSDEEISNFIKSSKAMEDRTVLLVSTQKNKPQNIRGGLALVSSKSTKEAMPFEKATGVVVERKKGRRVAEAVRFSVDENLGDRKLSEELLKQLVSSIKADKDLDSVYVYTSKKHERLYGIILKKMGLKFEKIKDLDRDVVLELKKTANE